MFFRTQNRCLSVILLLLGAQWTVLRADVSYHDLLNKTLENRADLVSTEYDIKRAEDEEAVALSGLFPKISIDAQVQKQKGDLYPNQQIHLGMTQSLYEPAGPLMQRELARTQTSLLRWELLDQKDQARFEMGQGYLSYRNKLTTEPFYAALDKSSHEQFKKAQCAYQLGLLSEQDFEQEKALFESNQSKVKSYPNDLSIARAELTARSEQPVKGNVDQFSSNLFFDHLSEGLYPFDQNDFIKEAMGARKELRVIDQQIEAAAVQKDIARYAYIPTINLIADVYKLSQPEYAGESTRPYRFGLSFGWQFDLANLHRFRSADASRLKAIFDRKHMEFTIERDVRTSCDELEVVIHNVIALKAKLEEARIAFERNKKAYEVGFISEVDFIQAKTNWEQTQTDLETEITLAAEKHEDLLWSTGYPEEQKSLFALLEKTA